VPILSQVHPVHNFTPCFPKIHFNIILPCTPRVFRVVSSLQVFWSKYCMRFSSLPCVLRACQSHPPWFDTLIRIHETYKLWSVSLFSFLQPHVTSSFLGPNIHPNTLFSNAINLCSSLKISDELSHPYNRTGEIIILYILYFIRMSRDSSVSIALSNGYQGLFPWG